MEPTNLFVTRGPGRPPVDSEVVRTRLERRVLDALNAYAADKGGSPARSAVVRDILSAWLADNGYLADGAS